MNDWKLKLSNKLLAENKYNYSDFVEFIQNQGKKEEKSNRNSLTYKEKSGKMVERT